MAAVRVSATPSATTATDTPPARARTGPVRRTRAGRSNAAATVNALNRMVRRPSPRRAHRGLRVRSRPPAPPIAGDQQQPVVDGQAEAEQRHHGQTFVSRSVTLENPSSTRTSRRPIRRGQDRQVAATSHRTPPRVRQGHRQRKQLGRFWSVWEVGWPATQRGVATDRTGHYPGRSPAVRWPAGAVAWWRRRWRRWLRPVDLGQGRGDSRAVPVGGRGRRTDRWTFGSRARSRCGADRGLDSGRVSGTRSTSPSTCRGVGSRGNRVGGLDRFHVFRRLLSASELTTGPDANAPATTATSQTPVPTSDGGNTKTQRAIALPAHRTASHRTAGHRTARPRRSAAPAPSAPGPPVVRPPLRHEPSRRPPSPPSPASASPLSLPHGGSPCPSVYPGEIPEGPAGGVAVAQCRGSSVFEVARWVTSTAARTVMARCVPPGRYGLLGAACQALGPMATTAFASAVDSRSSQRWSRWSRNEPRLQGGGEPGRLIRIDPDQVAGCDQFGKVLGAGVATPVRRLDAGSGGIPYPSVARTRRGRRSRLRLASGRPSQVSARIAPMRGWARAARR